MSYFDKSRSEMLAYVKDAPSCVLEVGCGAGVFGGLLKEKYESFVVGIEIDSAAAGLAKKKLDIVYADTFENLLANNKLEYRFDLIILNDVIEHMVDPLKFITLLKNVMRPQSKIVCSIPNFLYIDNVYEILVKKDFRYRESGILDKTHLRFFTKKSVVRLFESAGYHVDTISPLNYNKSIKWRLFNKLTFSYFIDFLIFQYAVVLTLDTHLDSAAICFE